VLRTVVVALILACTAVAAAGCGGSDKPAVCSARDDLSKSVDSLIDVNPVSDGLSEVRTRLADVQTQTTELAKEAGDEFAPQVNAFKQSITKVASDVTALAGSGDKAAAVGALATDVSAAKASWDALYSAVGSACD
jgi:hypothetical protein